MKKLVLALAMVTGLSFSSKADEWIAGSLMRICKPDGSAISRCVGDQGRCLGIHLITEDSMDYTILTTYLNGDPNQVGAVITCSEVTIYKDEYGVGFDYVEVP